MKYKEKMTPSDTRVLWLSRIIIWLVMLVVIFPALWIVMSSFSAGTASFYPPCSGKLSTEHYVALFGRRIICCGYGTP